MIAISFPADSERACLAAARTQWNRYAPPIGKRERGTSIDLAGRMANYRTWWAWYSAQPKHLGGDYRLRTAVGRGEVGDTHEWATSPSGFQYDVDAAWTWLQRVEVLPGRRAFIRDSGPCLRRCRRQLICLDAAAAAA